MDSIFLKDFVKYVNQNPIPTPVPLNNANQLGISMKEPLKAEDFIKEFENAGTLTFTDEEKKEAISFFKTINYYRFSIYPKLLLPDSSHSFSQALALYNFDEYLRNQLNIFISIIENSLKGSIIYSLVHSYQSSDFHPSQCYLDVNIYSSVKWGNSIIEVFSEQIMTSKNPSIAHHKSHRNACFPIWVLFEEITFGTLDTFISQLTPAYKANWVAQYYTPKYKKPIISWISSLRVLRNKIAHHSRLYGAKTPTPPGNLKEDKRIFNSYEYLGRKYERRSMLFGSFYVIKNLLAFGSPQEKSEWNHFLHSLEKKLITNSNIELELLGFPEDWKQRFILL